MNIKPDLEDIFEDTDDVNVISNIITISNLKQKRFIDFKWFSLFQSADQIYQTFDVR